MNELFISVVNMSISASWIVLAVLLFRVIFRKAPKWISVLLWGFVAIRLICPFSVESALSLLPSGETINRELALNIPVIDSGIAFIDNTVNPIISDATVALEPEKEINAFQFIMPYLAGVWYIGAAVMMIYAAGSFIRLKMKIGTAVRMSGNIFQSENASSPFVLGIIRPRIYLPFSIKVEDINFVVAHEKAHISRKDYIWKPLGFLLLTIHWFNPLVWLGYILLCRDIELACDERVVDKLSVNQRADYSQALLNCSINKRLIAACPIAFGEIGVGDRVKSVLKYKRPSVMLVASAMVVCVIVAICFLTNPESVRLRNMEQLNLDYSEYKTVSAHIYDEGENRFIENVDPEELEQLLDLRISGNEVSMSRSEERDKAHTVVLISQPEENISTSFFEETRIHFSSDFKSVWLDTGVKPTLSYRVINPRKARECFEGMSEADKDIITDVEAKLSYANWTQSNEFYMGALNRMKFALSSMMHLPIYKFDNEQELEQFKDTYSSTFTMDAGWDEVPSFNETTESYKEEFFKENSLLLVYVGVGNSTHRFFVPSLGLDDETLCVNVIESTKAEAVDSAMSGWFITVAVPKDIIKDYKSFDAVLYNGMQEIYRPTPETEIADLINSEEYIITVLHYKDENNMWWCNGHSYKYRLIISGRMHNAARDSSYIVLSNSKDITFDQTWRAAGFSSNLEDYFKPEDAVIVGERLFVMSGPIHSLGE